MQAATVYDRAASNAVVREDAGERDTRKAGFPTSSRLGKWATRLFVAAGASIAMLVLVLTVGPRFLPYQAYTVLSGSMEPTLPVGSVIIAVPARAEELRTGDIITVANPQLHGMLVTHRITGIDETPQGRAFTTKGDANQAPDSWLVPAQGSGWRYAFSVPYLGYGLAALQSELGRLLLLVIPTLLLGGLLLVEIWRPARASETAPDGAIAVGA
ncbi:MAG: signal peptidase I [Chloroflexota bacterium]|nr:signal peptidase I [Chloroflexota bacterium]